MESKLKRFDELIELGKSLLTSTRTGFSNVQARKEGWATRCIYLLEKTFGTDSIYTRRFKGVFNYSNEEAHVVHGLQIMETAKDEVEAEKDSTELDRLKEKIEEGKAEAERRATVTETKQWGAAIEIIDILRDELKKRRKRDQEMLDIHKQLEEIKQLLVKLNDKIENTGK